MIFLRYPHKQGLWPSYPMADTTPCFLLWQPCWLIYQWLGKKIPCVCLGWMVGEGVQDNYGPIVSCPAPPLQPSTPPPPHTHTPPCCNFPVQNDWMMVAAWQAPWKMLHSSHQVNQRHWQWCVGAGLHWKYKQWYKYLSVVTHQHHKPYKNIHLPHNLLDIHVFYTYLNLHVLTFWIWYFLESMPQWSSSLPPSFGCNPGQINSDLTRADRRI